QSSRWKVQCEIRDVGGTVCPPCPHKCLVTVRQECSLISSDHESAAEDELVNRNVSYDPAQVTGAPWESGVRQQFPLRKTGPDPGPASAECFMSSQAELKGYKQLFVGQRWLGPVQSGHAAVQP
ncbi:hypothetical protein IRJ41_022341, partial [Triplophysa rosa]